jgi:hypothetical protein
MRQTKKLLNKNTEEGIISGKNRPKAKTKKEIRQVKCPYFRKSSNKICVRMAEKGLDARLSDFDIQHFCNGNPINCFFYRLSPSRKEDESKPFLQKHRFFNILVKPRRVQG